LPGLEPPSASHGPSRGGHVTDQAEGNGSGQRAQRGVVKPRSKVNHVKIKRNRG
ncbi:hypothetical protein ElyMa_006878400, partial [Elysia marginata]